MVISLFPKYRTFNFCAISTNCAGIPDSWLRDRALPKNIHVWDEMIYSSCLRRFIVDRRWLLGKSERMKIVWLWTCQKTALDSHKLLELQWKKWLTWCVCVCVCVTKSPKSQRSESHIRIIPRRGLRPHVHLSLVRFYFHLFCNLFFSPHLSQTGFLTQCCGETLPCLSLWVHMPRSGGTPCYSAG